MRARDFRAKAREALRGKWLKTALILLLGMLLGGATGVNAPNITLNFENTSLEAVPQGIPASSGSISEALEHMIEQDPRIAAFLLSSLVISLLALLGAIFLGSWVRIGMVQLGCRVTDGEAPRVSMLFPRGIYWKAVGLNLLKGLYTFLWSMLFVIPGIIAAYRYAMADYILYNNPEIGVNEALRRSKCRMTGRKWRLFCLQFSFIGWSFAIVMGIAVLSLVLGIPQNPIVLMAVLIPVSLIADSILTAYMHMADIVFFREAERSFSWLNEACEGAEYAEENNGFSEDVQEDAFRTSFAVPHLAKPAPAQSALSADETVAKDMFFDYGCSRRRMADEGVLEDYEGMRISPIVQMRWVREYGDALMLRFDRDVQALDAILDLCAEYALDDLANRAMMRIERHIRQQTLDDSAILDMCGRMLAMLLSGPFDGDPGFLQRRRDQISDMADRLEKRLSENDPEGEWRKALALVRRMCGLENF